MYNNAIKCKSLTITVSFANFAKITGRQFEAWVRIGLAGGKRLVFKPNHNPVPKKDDGGINWTLVTSVIIVFIGDYHD